MVAQDLTGVDVKCYTYRRASVGTKFLEVPRDLLRDFEEALARKAGVSRDNHTVYALSYGNLGRVETSYVWFTDQKVFFGRTIDERGY